jgi:hypothetical protein
MTSIDNYKQEELTIEAGKAQLSVIIYFLPFLLLFGLPYFLIWRNNLTIQNYINPIKDLGQWTIVIIFSSMIMGIILHELIHGLTWSIFAKNGLKSMKYGVIWKWLTPYCHCKEPLLVKEYIIGALMPAIILGFIPSIMAIFTGNITLILFGLFFTMAAGGDFMIINILRKEAMDSLVQDHSSKIGCYIYRPINSNL